MFGENNLHKKALNNISEIVFYLDKDLKITWANQAAIDYFDKDLTSLNGQKCYEKWNWKDKCDSCPVIRANKSKSAEEGIMKKANNQIWKMKAIPVFNNAEELDGFIEIASDLKPVKDLQEEQAKYEEIYNAKEYIQVIDEAIKQKRLLEMNKFFVDNADILIFRVSPDGIIKYANQTALDSLGYSEAKLEYLSVDSFIPEDEYIPRDKFWKAIKISGSLTYESNFITKTEDSFPVEITSQYFEYEGNEYEFVFAKDISVRKSYELIIKELNKVAVEFNQLKNEAEIFEKTIETAKHILKFDLCGIALAKGDRFVPAGVSAKIDFDFLPINHGIIGKAYKNNKSYLNTDIDKNPEAKPTRNTYKSGIVIPMQDIGVFQAVSNKKSAFNQRDLEFAEILIASTQAALERVYHQKKLNYKTFHDSLTDLYNRSFFEEELKRLDTKRQLPLSIIMADLNGLKIINDSYGHEKGDELLIKAAEILKGSLRDEDILARQGGDEFAVLLPKTSSDKLDKIIKRIQDKISTENKNGDLPISIALGSATKERPAQDINDIFKEADDNMYQNKLLESRSSKNNIVQGLLNTLSAKSDETKEHAIRMTSLAFNFGSKLGLSNSELNKLSLLATMHDIGKTSISEEILNKPGSLNDREWEIIKKHSEQGYKIASATSEFSIIAEDILAHHERWDGSGYPRKLSGKEIPELARIISIIDAYDVMTNKRTYNQPVNKGEALEEISYCAGSQFDPELANEFIKMMK